MLMNVSKTCMQNAILLKGNVVHTRNIIAIYKSVLSLSSAYQACIFCLDFQFLEIKTNVAKESSATGYKYMDRLWTNLSANGFSL